MVERIQRVYESSNPVADGVKRKYGKDGAILFEGLEETVNQYMLRIWGVETLEKIIDMTYERIIGDMPLPKRFAVCYYLFEQLKQAYGKYYVSPNDLQKFIKILDKPIQVYSKDCRNLLGKANSLYYKPAYFREFESIASGLQYLFIRFSQGQDISVEYNDFKGKIFKMAVAVKFAMGHEEHPLVDKKKLVEYYNNIIEHMNDKIRRIEGAQRR